MPSYQELVRRMDALEKRQADLEKQIKALKSRPKEAAKKKAAAKEGSK